MGLASLGAGVGAGLGFAGGAFNKLGPFAVAGRAATGSIITQGIGTVTGLQKSFSWSGVAAAAMGADVGASLGDFGGTSFVGTLVRGAASAIANAATRSALDGTQFGDNLRAAIPDVVAQALWAGTQQQIVESRAIRAAKANPVHEQTHASDGYSDGTGTGLGPLTPIEVSELEDIQTVKPLEHIEVSDLPPIRDIREPRLKPEKYGPPEPPKKYGPPLPPTSPENEPWWEPLNDFRKSLDGVVYLGDDANVGLAIVGEKLGVVIAFDLQDGIPQRYSVSRQNGEIIQQTIEDIKARELPQTDIDDLTEIYNGLGLSAGFVGGYSHGNLDNFHGTAHVSAFDVPGFGGAVFSPAEASTVAGDDFSDLDFYMRNPFTNELRKVLSGTPGAGGEISLSGAGFGIYQGDVTTTPIFSGKLPWANKSESGGGSW